MKSLIFLAFLFPAMQLRAQHAGSYLDSIKSFQSHYTQANQVVTGSDKKFLEFFPVDSSFRVEAKFVRIENGPWFEMRTSGKSKQIYRQYAELVFAIQGKPLHLFAYQSQFFLNDKEYKNYLFAPFTDSSSGLESYGAGRYLDLSIADVHDNMIFIDFNKSYNPYCAYSHEYECPLPPKENDLPFYISAGEKNFGKKPH